MSGKNVLTQSANFSIEVEEKELDRKNPRPLQNVTLASINPSNLTAEEERFWFQVYASTRTEEMALTDWTPAQQDNFLRMQYQAQTSSYRLEFPNADNYAVLSDGAAAGRLILNRSDDEILLVDVALLPEFRQQGIGGFLMSQLMHEACEARKAVRLYVERFNPALQWYEGLGFRVINQGAVYFEMVWRPETALEVAS